MNIQLEKISKQFDEKEVFKDITLTFLEGQINCLMGASGIGKTTLIHIMMGLMKQDFGEITGLSGKRISVVFQEDRLIEHWDAIDNIKLVCGKEISEDGIIRELEAVGLYELKNKPVSKLSGGMRRRVAIVRALLSSSDLVIMDEPFKGLDDELRHNVIEYVREKVMGRTLIVVTHEKEDLILLQANLVTMD